MARDYLSGRSCVYRDPSYFVACMRHPNMGEDGHDGRSIPCRGVDKRCLNHGYYNSPVHLYSLISEEVFVGGYAICAEPLNLPTGS